MRLSFFVILVPLATSMLVGCDQVRDKLGLTKIPSTAQEAVSVMQEKASTGDLEEASQIGKKFLASSSDDEFGQVSLAVGSVLADLGRPKEALHFLELAVASDSSNLLRIIDDEKSRLVWVRRNEIRAELSRSSPGARETNFEGLRPTENEVSAGDVSIKSSGDRTEIRAGSVVIRSD